MNASLEDGTGQADCFADNWAAWGLLDIGAGLPAPSLHDTGPLPLPPSLHDAPTSRTAALFRLARQHGHVVATRARCVRGERGERERERERERGPGPCLQTAHVTI
jgi:hypothetical protein